MQDMYKRLNVRGANVRVYRNGSVYLMRKKGEKRLAPSMHQKHLQVNIPLFRQENGRYKYRQQRVDQLVCEAFLGRKPGSYEKITHIDGNPRNCQAENLKMEVKSNDPKARKKRGYTAKCKRGHSLLTSNVYADKRYSGGGSCKACSNAKVALRREVSLEASRNEEMIQEVSRWYFLKHTNPGINVREEIQQALEKCKADSQAQNHVLE